MATRPSSSEAVGWPWLLAIEGLCVAGCAALWTRGQSIAAITVLVSPLCVLVLAFALRSDFRLLIVFTALLPLSGSGLLPAVLDKYVLLPGTLLLLLIPAFLRGIGTAGGRTPEASRADHLLLLLLGIWSVVSALNATLHGWASRWLVTMTVVTFEVVLLTYFYSTVPKTLRQVRLLMYAAVAVSTVVALLLPALRSPASVVSPLVGKMVVTPFGDVNLNTIAYVIGPLTAMALGLAAATGRPQTRLILLAAVVIGVPMLLYTKSRGAWLGVAAAFVYVLVVRRSAMLVLLAAGTALVVAGSDVMRALLASRVSATSVHDFSLLGRLRLWDYAWRIGGSNWLFGVGLENFRYVKHFYDFPEPLRWAVQFNSHNLFLEFFVGLGALGLLVFLWLFVGAIVRSTRLAGDVGVADVGLGLGAGLVAYGAHGLFDCVLFVQGVYALLGTLIGLSICAWRVYASRGSGPRSRSFVS